MLRISFPSLVPRSVASGYACKNTDLKSEQKRLIRKQLCFPTGFCRLFFFFIHSVTAW